MQRLKRFECGKEYSIKGILVKADNILSYGRGQLSGLQIVHFASSNGLRFKATQWTDGTVYRVIKETSRKK